MPRRATGTIIPEPPVPPEVDDPPSEPDVAPTIPVPEPDPTHSPVLPEPERSGPRSNGGRSIGASAPTRPRSASRPTAEQRSTYDWLYEEARRRGLRGRSSMSKRELARALGY